MKCYPFLQTALIVALLNIKIPHELGGLVNIVSTFTSGEELQKYLERLTRPVLRLCVLYVTQVCVCVCCVLCVV